MYSQSQHMMLELLHVYVEFPSNSMFFHFSIVAYHKFMSLSLNVVFIVCDIWTVGINRWKNWKNGQFRRRPAGLQENSLPALFQKTSKFRCGWWLQSVVPMSLRATILKHWQSNEKSRERPKSAQLIRLKYPQDGNNFDV